MGFNSVYQTLRELFPQVDARIVKAVAIEHSKDPDGAVESILTEVLPFMSQVPMSTVESRGKTMETTSPKPSILRSNAGNDTNASDMLNDGHSTSSVSLNNKLDDSLASSFYDAKDSDDQPSGNTENEELILAREDQRTSIESAQGQKFGMTFASVVASHTYEDSGVAGHVAKIDDDLSSSVNVETGEVDVSLSNGQNGHPDTRNDYSSYDLNATPSWDSPEEKTFLNCNSMDHGITTEQISISTEDHMLNASHSGMPLSNGTNQETNDVGPNFIEESFENDADGAKDETVLSTIVTRSGQVCKINLLEEIIEDAKNHKGTLFSEMESVIRLIKEVELQEEAAKQAKEAAARGGLDILEKAEDLRKMLQHAKEVNDMHAGEVYGEKSILATEVRELQTRLLGLSDEKDKSLSILDEMQRTLEARLVAAEEERRAAEQDMFEKEESARTALAEQERIMEKVVQDSKLLKQEAEENAKLRDFLIEKGRVVDLLQGEISVICQDVKSLKENFDNHVSLSKSLSSKHTSCLLASSSSSMKSTSSDPAPGLMALPLPEQLIRTSLSQTSSVGCETPSRMSGSRTPSVGCQTPRSSVSEEVNRADAAARKELLDEDWELFDF